jgi:preprotein translocase subunit YajC
MTLKAGDSVRTRNGRKGTVIQIEPDRTVIVLFEDEGGRLQPSDLELVETDAAATSAWR